MEDIAFQFSGVRRLYGSRSFSQFAKSHVLIIGLGGVGSWVVEALARSGVGGITLVDFDDVCLSNVNRQLHATVETVGQPKTLVLKNRIHSINPNCEVNIIETIFSENTSAEVFQRSYDCIVDCIDQSHNKIHSVLAGRERGIPVVLSGAAGGLKDPSLIRVDDLSVTREDQMLAQLRKFLRVRHEFPRGRKKFNVRAVFSLEEKQYIDDAGEPMDEKPKCFSSRPNCKTGLGTSVAVTAVFGFNVAAEVLKILADSANS